MKFSYISILFFLYFLFLVSCNQHSAKTIRIGILNGPSKVSFIQMIDQPATVSGMEVEFITKSEPLQIQALMMQNKLDFAILPTSMAANLYNKGIKYKMVACPIWGTLYLLTNTEDNSLAALSAKKVAVFGQSTTSDILLHHMLDKEGIRNVNIDYSFATNNEVAVALLQGKVNYGVISEPLVSVLLGKDSTIRILKKIDCEEYLDNIDKDIFVQTAFLVNARFSEQKPGIVKQICDLYSASCNFTSEQPVKTAELMVKHGISPDTAIARRSIPLCNINYMGAFALEQEIRSYLKIFHASNPKSIGGKLPDKGFILQSY
ncbi:MAG TPA: ABC transporter substrate-binding protein [Paludibacter sp.]|nr:ABC transporter substrate-binding protein [Paludibacter sp.]